MRVRVRIGGLLEKPSGMSELDLELPEGASVREMLEAAGFRPEHASRIMASVNGTIRKPEFVLKTGDEVSLSILVGGG